MKPIFRVFGKRLLAVAGPLALLSCSPAEEAPKDEELAAQEKMSSAPERDATEPLKAPGLENLRPGPECAAGQASAFSCKVATGKQLSVCVADEPAAVEYRFGKPGMPAEIVLNEGPEGGPPLVSNVPYSGGGEAQIRFANKTTDYIVFSRIIRTRFDGEGNDPAFSAGVMVAKEGNLVAAIECTDPSDADLDIGRLEPRAKRNDEAFFTPD